MLDGHLVVMLTVMMLTDVIADGSLHAFTKEKADEKVPDNVRAVGRSPIIIMGRR